MKTIVIIALPTRVLASKYLLSSTYMFLILVLMRYITLLTTATPTGDKMIDAEQIYNKNFINTDISCSNPYKSSPSFFTFRHNIALLCRIICQAFSARSRGLFYFTSLWKATALPRIRICFNSAPEKLIVCYGISYFFLISTILRYSLYHCTSGGDGLHRRHGCRSPSISSICLRIVARALQATLW